MNIQNNVFIICPGLGHVNRGYESFTQECFDTLKDNSSFNLLLIKGVGPTTNKNKTAFCLRRNSLFTKLLGKLINKEPYLIEQFSFFITLIPFLIIYKPKIIFYSDFNLGTFLWHLRKFLKFKYKLLFSNGAPNGPPFTRTDHIQQHLPTHLARALNGGTSLEMQTLIPYGIKFAYSQLIAPKNESTAIKLKLNIPLEKKIILSAGAVNKSHKRMDYLINEVALLSDEYYLIILGQYTSDTPFIQEMANRLLGNRCIISTVSNVEMPDYYNIADVFVLASLSEGLPRVLPEAMSFGLPCFVHDYPVTRETLEKFGFYVDATVESALANSIATYFSNILAFDRQQMKQFAYNKYSWDNLKEGYSMMINNLMIN